MALIRVTEAHIKAGERGACRNCPIALAILDVVKPGVAVNVGGNHVRVSCRGIGDWMCPTPPDAWLFIAVFDTGGEVKPTTLDIDIPREFLR